VELNAPLSLEASAVLVFVHAPGHFSVGHVTDPHSVVGLADATLYVVAVAVGTALGSLVLSLEAVLVEHVDALAVGQRHSLKGVGLEVGGQVFHQSLLLGDELGHKLDVFLQGV